ncbi:MAG: Trk system potassium transporter TrkA [Spirochaetaceae bacterium]|jgi:trk system potassium uptake protein TrkA|nr:Trk system potassium transporter TrkA [Spirochaetaceae bacterium]
MRVIIVGAGLVGTQLAKYLIQEKHDVSLIESNEERARHASNRLDCLVLHDGGNSLSVLEEAGLDKADALVCVTGSDEVNMIICGLAASRQNGPLKIARVRNDDYVWFNRPGTGRILGIDHFVHPDVEAARTVLDAVEHGAMGEILSFANTSYELGSIDIAEKSAFDGLAVKDFRALVKAESLVTLLERGGECILPSGSTTLMWKDRIYILAKEEDMSGIFTLAGGLEKPLRKIGIVGGGRIGSLIAEGLLKNSEKKLPPVFSFFKSFIPKSIRRVIIIEKDYSLCKDLAARFPEALILNEDISDESFVSEERIDDLDLIITATANQELNMIAALYLKSRGVHRAIAIVTGQGYTAIARKLGVDVVLPRQSVVVDSILSHLMGERVKGVHRIGDGSTDSIEIEISRNAAVLGTSLARLRLPQGALVMLVQRGEESFIPTGDYVFTEKDRIILIAKTGSEADLERLFGVSP